MEKSHDGAHGDSSPEETPRSGGPFLVWTLLGMVAGLALLVALNMK